MSNERLSVALENGRFAKVTMWQNEPRLDLRQWEIGQTNNKLTKKGISLKLHQVKTLNNGMESIQESLKKKRGFEVASGDERLRFGSKRQPLC
uniref:Transcriptional coactivator p15 (PC4) C-terminal domain-containing protein n=1 Tax=Magallana gigas TaxID=29159 RepID=K1Q3H7_MAGGI